MIDIEQIYKFKDELPAADAKAAIQKYCKEHGVKVPKTGISVKDQINLIMDKLDAMANGVSDVPSFGPPEIDEEIKVDVTPVTEVTECDGACSIDLGTDIEEVKPTGTYTVADFLKDQVIDVSIPKVNFTQMEAMGILKSIGNGDVPSSGHHIVHIGNDYRPKSELIGYGKDAYLNLPYWVLDWILEQPRDWKINVMNYTGHDKDFLIDMLYYIQVNGKVRVRESRNSEYHHFF